MRFVLAEDPTSLKISIVLHIAEDSSPGGTLIDRNPGLRRQRPSRQAGRAAGKAMPDKGRGTLEHEGRGTGEQLLLPLDGPVEAPCTVLYKAPAHIGIIKGPLSNESPITAGPGLRSLSKEFAPGEILLPQIRLGEGHIVDLYFADHAVTWP